MEIQRYGDGTFVAKGDWDTEEFLKVLLDEHEVVGLAEDVRRGYMRHIPLAPGWDPDGYTYYIEQAGGPGRGAFMATWIDVV